MMKCFFLFLFITIPACLLSQQQYSLLGMMINDDGLASGMERHFLTEKNGLIYDHNGDLCNGNHVDYYDSDKKKVRISGRFKKGVPVDTIKGYYENGVVKFNYLPFEKKYKYKGVRYNYCRYREYDERGFCVRSTDDMNGIERRYHMDGRLFSVLHYYRKKSKVIYYEEYHPDNKKKTIVSNSNRYDYDENERIRRHWVRKSERYNKRYGTMSATFNFEEYDVLGNVTKIGRFYTNLYEHDQWLHISPEFPVSIDSVPVQDFKEITYPHLNMKDVYRWDYANNRTIIIRYTLKNEAWVEVERLGLPRSN